MRKIILLAICSVAVVCSAPWNAHRAAIAQQTTYCVTNSHSCCAQACAYKVCFSYCDNPTSLGCEEIIGDPSCYQYCATINSGDTYCFPFSDCDPEFITLTVELPGSGKTYRVSPENPTIMAESCISERYGGYVEFGPNGATINVIRQYCIINESEYCSYDVCVSYTQNTNACDWAADGAPPTSKYLCETLGPGESKCFPIECDPLDLAVSVRLAGGGETTIVDVNNQDSISPDHCNNPDESEWGTWIRYTDDTTRILDAIIQ